MKHIILIAFVAFLAGCCRHRPEVKPYCEFTQSCYGRVPMQVQPYVRPVQQQPCANNRGCSMKVKNVGTTTESFVDPETNRVITINVNVSKAGNK